MLAKAKTGAVNGYFFITVMSSSKKALPLNCVCAKKLVEAVLQSSIFISFGSV